MQPQDGKEVSGDEANGSIYQGGESENMEEVSGESGSPSSGETDQGIEPEKNFFIIAGSFRHLQNASDLQDRLKARGYPAEILITENRMYRVSVSSYATKPEAEKALAGIKADRGLEASWLLSN